jgi:hypothetical protein
VTAYNVGSGVRQAMLDAGDEPRSNEIYLNAPGAPALSQTFGRDAIYYYIGEDNRVHRIPFDA